MYPRMKSKSGAIAFITVIIIVLGLGLSAKAFHNYYHYTTQQIKLRQDKSKAVYLALAAEQYAMEQLAKIPPILSAKGTLASGEYSYEAKLIKPFTFEVECRGKTKKGSPSVIQLIVKRSLKDVLVLERKE